MTSTSFNFCEMTAESAQPVFLVHLTDGVTHWRWTTASYDIGYDGETYSDEPGLVVKKHTISDNDQRAAKEIEVPWGNTLIQTLISDPPDAPIEVEILKGHTDTTWDYQLYGQGVYGEGIYGGHEFIRHWDGWLMGHELRGNRTAVLHCTPWWSDLGQAGLCRRSGISCQVPLYSTPCGVIKANFKATGTILTVSGTTITAAVLGLQVDGYYTGGLLETDTHSRMIESHTGTTAILSHAIVGLAAGDIIRVYPGCNHLWAGHCKTRFSNGLNFQGDPDRATSNMFSEGVL